MAMLTDKPNFLIDLALLMRRIPCQEKQIGITSACIPHSKEDYYEAWILLYHRSYRVVSDTTT